MSTIFGHGRLRLYLLKLLDESPRHGYEIISLLRDRFLGVYSPSPGTIYPRLARLEEEGLVTHTEEGGRKVYSLTDKGREELRARESDLDDLEQEITDSVRDIARAVKQDVRATIGSLREELKFAAGGARREESERTAASDEAGREKGEGDEEPRREGDRARECGDGGMWAREWERFAQGFGAFGAAWGRPGSEHGGASGTEGEGSEREEAGREEAGREGPEFEQALRDFSTRVRDMVRGAGQVGGSAAHDLRRILDDTVEVIRRDMGRWGPTKGEHDDEGRGPSERGEDEPTTGETDAPREPSSTPTSEGEGEDPSERREARPMPKTGGDPWSTATGEDAERSD
ncbi:PadR family transcriptional regulator [Nocardiopsis sp. MG754419]|uniref:PadR family transcriptional regulator n=1 Tax=Nocardiopsis sp. MG754419 TaxID=2259865 RepID=UPI001BA70FED|nr:PadR family transcriptional regulator [Nocardiopsis sp. MG754419]MBR8740715.1 PadR family transcriptional regulator [Nocardiopsis sp. MG754419]